MKNIILLLITLPLLPLTNLSLGREVQPVPETREVRPVEKRVLDQRAEILADYFASYNSPLQYQAQDFIDAADQYGVDWRLTPAISGVESTFGKNSYGYNAWGWGIYGDNRLNFSSWRDGIYTVTAGLREGYIDKGLKDPFAMNKVYAASPSWGWKVNYFMKDLEKFEAEKDI